MKTKWMKILSATLAALMLTAGFAACADTSENEETKADSVTVAGTSGGTPVESKPGETEPETDGVQFALDSLGEIDFGDREFGVLYQDTFEGEAFSKGMESNADGGTAQVINDAVYTRNSLLEDRCNLKLAFIKRDVSSLTNMVQNESTAPTGDFKFIDTYIFNNASLAINNHLSDMNRLGANLEGEWWDKGTADFVLKGGVYFMTGSLTFADDNTTYVMIFNKEMQKTYANTVPNPYNTVRAGEWTLDYFNQIIQGISAENGNGEWGAEDTYGFVTTWEYGTTFFHGADLRYILNDANTDLPSLHLNDKSRMEKALEVIEMSQKIYHENHATFMSPGGQENLGTTAFVEGRAMFFGDTCMYLAHFNSTMTGEYGVLPIPKYDKDQEFYRTWTHPSGSSFSVTTSVSEEDREVVGQILTAYAILSHQHVKPAFYDTVLTSRNVHDADSVEMLDILFSNRVYDMAFYFELNLGDLVKNAVNNNTTSFSSAYTRATNRFDQKIERFLQNLDEAD